MRVNFGLPMMQEQSLVCKFFVLSTSQLPPPSLTDWIRKRGDTVYRLRSRWWYIQCFPFVYRRWCFRSLGYCWWHPWRQRVMHYLIKQYKRMRTSKSCLSVAPLVFPRLKNSSKNISVARNLPRASTLTRLWLTVLRHPCWSWREHRYGTCRRLSPYPWHWNHQRCFYQAHPLSTPLANPRYSPLPLTINRLFSSKSLRVNGRLQKTTISLASLSTPESRGVPQIEVTFEIDANGIMNVSADCCW